MDFNNTERELKKRLKYPYKWLQKQNNYFDTSTNFIYHIFNFDELLEEIEKNFKDKQDYDRYFNYALNRWYNFWSANAVEKIFCEHPDVIPALDEKDRLVDFTIQGAKFDHKTSVFPKSYKRNLKDAFIQTDDLIKWLYTNQSQQQRKHLKNRLFIVLYSTEGEHWKLKAEINWLRKIIDNYMIGFNPAYLMKFEFEKRETVISDIIWAIK